MRRMAVAIRVAMGADKNEWEKFMGDGERKKNQPAKDGAALMERIKGIGRG